MQIKNDFASKMSDLFTIYLKIRGVCANGDARRCLPERSKCHQTGLAEPTPKKSTEGAHKCARTNASEAG